MGKLRSVYKIRDKQGRIDGYRIADEKGNTQDIKSEDLKELIKSGKLHISNLKLTTDGRLIDHREDLSYLDELEILAIVYDENVLDINEDDITSYENAALADEVVQFRWFVRRGEKFGVMKPDELYISITQSRLKVVNGGLQYPYNNTERYFFIKRPFSEIAAISACDSHIHERDDKMNIKMLKRCQLNTFVSKILSRKDFESRYSYVKTVMAKLPGLFDTFITPETDIGNYDEILKFIKHENT